MATFMLAENLPIIRQALRTLLESMGHTVSMEVDNGADALAKLRHQAVDLVILELSLTRQGGLDLVRRIKGHHHAQKLLVYSSQSAEHFAPLCFGAGADGFLSKHEPLSQLETAIKEVLRGGAYFLREHMEHGRGGELDGLTAREMTILQMVAEGQSNKAIAEQLSISFKTVSTHKTHLQEKLNVSSRMELCEVARRNGLAGLQIAEHDEQPGHATPGRFELVQALIDASPYPMFIRDTDSSLLFCNQRFLDFHQTDFEQIKGTRLADQPWLLPADRERIQNQFEQLIGEGTPLSVKRVVNLRGKNHVLYVWGMPYRAEDGQVIAMLGGVEDLTRHDSLLAELRDAKEAAEWENRSRLSNMAEVLDELQSLSLALANAAQGLPVEAPAHQLNDRLASLHTILHAIQRSGENRRPADLNRLLRQWAQLHAARWDAEPTDAAWGWIDTDVLGALLQELAALLLPAFDVAMTLREEAGARLLLSVTIRGTASAAPPSKTQLLACRRLADCLDASFDWQLEGSTIVFSLSLECPKANRH